MQWSCRKYSPFNCYDMVSHRSKLSTNLRDLVLIGPVRAETQKMAGCCFERFQSLHNSKYPERTTSLQAR